MTSKVCRVAGCHRQVMSDEVFCHTHINHGFDTADVMEDWVPENSGGKCSYYEVDIANPVHQPRVYRAECIDLIESLELTPHEANVFKCIWRKAAERQGKGKEGNNALRDAEKILFFANRIHELERLK